MSRDLFDQGGFNGLLGVSSIVNSVSMLLPGKQIKGATVGEAVFKKLVEVLESEKQLKKVIFEGVSLSLMKKLVKQTEDFILLNCKTKLEIKSISKSGNNIDQVWKDMMATLAKSSKKAPLYLVVSLQRKHNTWKCVTKISDKQMLFEDTELKLLNKNNCTTGKTMDGGHMLSGDSIFSFSLEQPKVAVNAPLKAVAKKAPAKKVLAKKAPVKTKVAVKKAPAKKA